MRLYRADLDGEVPLVGLPPLSPGLESKFNRNVPSGLWCAISSDGKVLFGEAIYEALGAMGK